MTKFLDDATARHLAGETIRKSKNLRERRFIGWCQSKDYRLLKQITVDAMRECSSARKVERRQRILLYEREGEAADFARELASIWTRCSKRGRSTGAHSHRFRDTFAVSLLDAGVSIENVSVRSPIRR